jgi:LysR family transcriptional activator of nhaA
MNFKHLHYFLQVAKLGGVIRASEHLHLSPQTISTQILQLEESLGTKLFAKRGRGLVLTEAGETVLGYAEDIFSMGAELEETVRGFPHRLRPKEFRVGVADAVPKSIACRLLEPAMRLPESARIVSREWKLDMLLGELAMHRLDLVIADAPIPASVSVRAFNHRLGSSGTSFFATPALMDSCPGPFPARLDRAPLLLPSEDSALGMRLRAWLKAQSLNPRVVGECDDSALAKAFGRRGLGIFVGPTVLESEIGRQYGAKTMGTVPEIQEEFFAITVERRSTHPCVTAITSAARSELFGISSRRSAR